MHLTQFIFIYIIHAHIFQFSIFPSINSILSSNYFSNISDMKNQVQEHVIGILISSAAYSTEGSLNKLLTDHNLEIQSYKSPSNANSTFNQNKLESTKCRTNKLVKRTESFAHRVREYVRLGSKITETLKGKLSSGAKIFQLGGVGTVFNQKFDSREGEKLLKASKCYLSTTAGPIAGLLFISTDKVAFCSNRLIKVFCPTGEFHKVHYKVVIPLEKIERLNKRENLKQPSRKYIQIVTGDDFEFWFMGLQNYQKTIKCIQNALFPAIQLDQNSTNCVLPADAVGSMWLNS